MFTGHVLDILPALPQTDQRLIRAPSFFPWHPLTSKFTTFSSSFIYIYRDADNCADMHAKPGQPCLCDGCLHSGRAAAALVPLLASAWYAEPRDDTDKCVYVSTRQFALLLFIFATCHTKSHTVLLRFHQSLLVLKMGRVSSLLPLSEII